MALGQALSERGAKTRFVTGDGDTAAFVRDAGFQFRPGEVGDLGSSSDDVIVLDSYGISAAAAESVRGRCKVLVVVEDLPDRCLAADITIDTGFATGHGAAPRGQVLAGPQFALLEGSYAVPRPRRYPATVERVLVTVGSTDLRGLLVPLAQTAAGVFPRASVDVIAGPFVPGAVEARLSVLPQVTVQRSPQAMRELMARADLAVSAAGQTLLELCAAATPTIAVELFDNQARLLSALAGSGATSAAGRWCDRELLSSVAAALSRAAAGDVRARLGAAARATVDGQGAARCASAIVERLESASDRV